MEKPDITMEPLKSKSVVTNISYAVLEKTLYSVSTLILVPIAVKQLGMDVYGIWVLYCSLAAFFLLAQFGLSTSFERFIAAYRASNDHEKLMRVVATSFYSLCVIAIVIFAVSALCAEHVISWFAGTQVSRYQELLFIWFMGINAVMLVNQIFMAVPRGYLRYDISSFIGIAARLVETGLSIAFLLTGSGLAAFIWGLGASCVISTCAGFWVTSRTLGKWPIAPRMFSGSMLLELYRFGIYTQASFFAMWASANMDKLIISRLFGSYYVGLYDIGTRIPLLVRNTFSLIFAVLVPRASELFATGARNTLQRIYRHGSRYLAILSSAAAALLIPTAGSILELWLRKPADRLEIFVFQAIMVGVAVQLTAGIGSSVIRGVNKPYFETIANTGMALVNVVFSLSLCLLYGMNGVAWGTVLSLVAGTIFFEVLVNRELQVDQSSFFLTDIAVPFLWSLACTVAGVFVFPLLCSRFFMDVSPVMALAASVCVYGAALCGLTAVFYRVIGYVSLGEIIGVFRKKIL
ncbi:MAG: hypothetical protein A2268_08930 [Candidatus Raymondbacteria bacterium RifOxyA12_full_50_37]|uniref:Uncharacterized protein n=1 Tax=Candidatus Raymondbacteria bacterium RIFOXYD12_FULL_49_13 TaxID=1817890 RepID=A0A1F7FGT9_UNCRA|nr:MAG: hypothetical protein A2268_08930 [Candidatus Raymondbacteria bacterium RifOxyA12_full_50_37]OGJ92922.1 MAG: hypothetical protein A2248_08630 [Candidatus Raymondbacteria bacterium RIFOXYA2_FULL_49_16]OGK05692.1 MAG: hypothetical protein A2519_03840 [Candidatus Raymondbacteria bacterium RIFOXYD12_FULL_49_13]